MTHKICKSCGENLEVSNFTKSKNVKDGYENKCKKCRNKQSLKHLCKCETCGNEWLAKGKVLNTVAHPVNHNLKGLGIKWNVLYVARK